MTVTACGPRMTKCLVSAVTLTVRPGMVAESVERGPHVREIGSSILSRVKPMTYETDTCRFLAWRYYCNNRIGQGHKTLTVIQPHKIDLYVI